MSVRIDGNMLLEILEETPATQNIMLMGKHGIGKSQILEKFFTAKGTRKKQKGSLQNGRKYFQMI